MGSVIQFCWEPYYVLAAKLQSLNICLVWDQPQPRALHHNQSWQCQMNSPSLAPKQMEELNNPKKLIWLRKCVLIKRAASFTTCWSVILATSWQGILLVGFKDRSRWKCNTQIQMWHSGGGKPGQVKRLPSGERGLVTIRECLSLFPRPGLV